MLCNVSFGKKMSGCISSGHFILKTQALFRNSLMFRYKINTSSFSFNLIFSLLLFVPYNFIFFKKLYEVTGNGLDYICINLIIGLLLFIATNLLLWKHSTKILSCIFIVLNAVCLYFMSTFNISIDKIMLLNALETDTAESLDLLNHKFFTFVLLSGVVPCALLFFINIKFSSFKKELIRRLITILTCAAVIASMAFADFKYTAQFLRNNRDLKYDLLPVNYVGAVISAVKILRRSNHEYITVGTDAVYTPQNTNDKPNLIVLVIGETARAANFSLGGYEHDTNRDLLPYAKDLFYFEQTKSCGTSTAVSLPCIFSAQPRKHFKPGSEVYTDNLLDIFKRSGYNVLWRENNSGCKNICNRVETETFCSNYACKDEILLKNFEQKINSYKGNSLVVLHQQGSHGPAYFNRYPKEFERYTPTCQTEDLSQCSQQQVINTYDNSLAYTSYMLAQTIKQLQKLSASHNVILLYVSDHGESLGENGLYLHAAPYLIAPEEQTQVPFLIWLTNENAKAFNIDSECLRQKLSQPQSHDNLFHTMLHLGGIKTQVYNQELDILAECRKK